MASNERIGRALNSKNLRSDETHTDADVVGALAFASQLGASLQALYSAGHLDELSRSVDLLARTLMRSARRKRIGIGKFDALIVAQQAILEWHIKICRACNGTGNRLVSYTFDVEQPKKSDSCLHCEGTGVFMPPWHWRVQSMKLDDASAADPEWWDKRIALAREIAEDAYRAANRKVSGQLTE